MTHVSVCAKCLPRFLLKCAQPVKQNMYASLTAGSALCMSARFLPRSAWLKEPPKLRCSITMKDPLPLPAGIQREDC